MKLRLNNFWILILSLLSLIACGEEEQRKEIIRPVRYMQVFSTGGTRLRSFSGVAQSGLESKLSFKVPGTIKRIAVNVGDKVRAGEVIAQLDLDDYQLKKQQAQATLADAKAKARNAEANYERTRALYESKSASRTNLDAARAASESTEAGVQSAEKQLELAESQLSYATLKAPLSGAIADVDVEVNENVQAGQIVVVLTSGSEIEVKVSIPGILIAQIREGSEVKVAFDAIPGKEYLAHVSEVGIASVGMVTTFPVTVKLDRADSDIRPGMAAVVEFFFESKDQRERFIVPSHTVGEDQKGRFVYVVEPIPDQKEYGIAHLRSVTIGELTSEGLEIFEGLSDGELLITAGITRITDGQKVKI
jgi:RND family efflux transporter MFP subunit